jgi:Predicted membrane protein (DUF2254)
VGAAGARRVPGRAIAIVAGFLVLEAATYFLDQSLWTPGQQPPRGLRWLSDVFGDAGALSSLLGTIATSLITVTSITFSLLLLAVQQGASALTNQVFDQFLRRRGNQFYFGFFVGLSVFALINLVTASQFHRPIFGALIAVLLAAVALCLIVVLIYTTIDQMRPSMIVKAIHGHVLKARETQLSLLRATRRTASDGLCSAMLVLSERQGYVTLINVDRIARAVSEAGGRQDASGASDPGRIEVELLVVMGSHVAYRDPLAALKCRSGGVADAAADAIANAVISAIGLEGERHLDRDPALGIEQLATIGWTSVSTARSNPYPGILVCHALRDILARWTEQGAFAGDRSSPVVYDDRAPCDAVSTLGSLAVVASESLQHQTLAEIMRTFAVLIPKLAPERVDQVADTVLRSLSALGEHVLTRELESALDTLSQVLAAVGRDAPARAVMQATDTLRRSVGVLKSRSTRVPTGGG